LPLEADEPVPSKVTVVPTFASWFVPALATGAVLDVEMLAVAGKLLR
jgi:hypothetical protein